MKIANDGVLSTIISLLPHFVIAGRLACRVQDDIIASGNRNIDTKPGDRFTEALTDADIIVETHLGTVILANIEDATFYGEEHERDRVSNYFPKSAPYLITLDPIDGTRYFEDGLPIFSIILTICTENRIVGSVVYVPRKETFYIAAEKSGAFTTTAADVARRDWLTPYTAPSRAPVVVIYKNDLHLEPPLRAEGFDVVNQHRDYDGSLTWRRTNLGLFTGEVVGKIISNAQLIDAAAMAYIIGQAGGATSSTAFDPETKRVPGYLVVGVTPGIYKKLAQIVE